VSRSRSNTREPLGSRPAICRFGDGRPCHPARRPVGRAALLSVLIFLPFLLLSPAAIFCGERAPAKPVASPLGDLTIVRCLFGEGRIVVRYQGKLYVLHEGDAVPGTALVVARITPKQARLTQKLKNNGAASQAESGPSVLITEKVGGGWTLTTVREAPAAGAQTLPMVPPASTDKPRAAGAP
jgi:hypothetical protein